MNELQGGRAQMLVYDHLVKDESKRPDRSAGVHPEWLKWQVGEQKVDYLS